MPVINKINYYVRNSILYYDLIMEKQNYGRMHPVLSQVPPELWSSSPEISTALLECSRIHNIVRNALHRHKVKDSYFEEVVSEAAFVVQTVCIAGGLSAGGRQKGQLEKIEDVYYIIYQTIENIVRNHKKKRGRTSSTLEHEFSSFVQDGEGNEAFLERISDNPVDNGFDEVERKMDLDFAQKRLKAKIDKQGWPDFIPKDRPLGPAEN
jgi:hypothetical protein